MLRDVIRQISNGVKELGFYGKNVGLVDERGEVASVSNGTVNLDVGIRTDVMSNCTKSLGIEMLVRSMGISVVATDEIGSENDIEAIKYASLSGVSLVFTMHGKCIEDITNKTGMKELINQKLFKRVIILSNDGKPGNIQKIHSLN